MSMGVDRVTGRATGLDAVGASFTPPPGADGEASGFAALLRPAGGPPASGPGAAAAASPVSSLAWVEAGIADALTRDARDREARRHGRAMLQALAAVQLATLGGDRAQASAALESLAEVAEDGRLADDPVLRLILREIAVRAAVELARGRTGQDVSTG